MVVRHITSGVVSDKTWSEDELGMGNNPSKLLGAKVTADDTVANENSSFFFVGR